MKLATAKVPDRDAPVAVEVRGEEVVEFAGRSVRDVIAEPRPAPADGARHPLAEATFLAPIPEPRQIFCVGANYRAHAAEAGMEIPEAPAIFSKPGTASTAPTGPVVCPPPVRRLDYEVELAVVIGVAGAVAGYAVADDVSARDLQKRERHWTRAKGADTFCPWGPWITTADEIADPDDLRLCTWVNGELRQDSSTSDMIFGVDEVLSFIGETCSLRPGDLLLTGTPEGVGFAMDPPRFLQPGDLVHMEIEHLGSIEHAITT